MATPPRLPRRTLLVSTLGIAATAPLSRLCAESDPLGFGGPTFYDPFSLDNYERRRPSLYTNKGSQAVTAYLWGEYERGGDVRFGEWAMIYGWTFWRTSPLGDGRIRAARVGQTMAQQFRLSHGDHPAGYFFSAFYTGLLALSRGILDSLHMVPEFRANLETVDARWPGYFYGNSALVLAKMYVKLPPFPMSIGDIDRGLAVLEGSRKYHVGIFALWYLILAEGIYQKSGADAAFALLDRIDGEVVARDGITKFVKETTLIDAENFKRVVRAGKYNKYTWDPLLEPWTLG